MQDRPILVIPRIAAAPVPAFTFTGFDNQVAAAGSKPLGVSQYRADKAGDDLALVAVGSSRTLSGGAFADGAAIKVGANGRAVDQAGDGTIAGYALQAATGDNQVVEILLTP